MGTRASLAPTRGSPDHRALQCSGRGWPGPVRPLSDGRSPSLPALLSQGPPLVRGDPEQAPAPVGRSDGREGSSLSKRLFQSCTRSLSHTGSSFIRGAAPQAQVVPTTQGLGVAALSRARGLTASLPWQSPPLPGLVFSSPRGGAAATPRPSVPDTQSIWGGGLKGWGELPSPATSLGGVRRAFRILVDGGRLGALRDASAHGAILAPRQITVYVQYFINALS
ncbi:hypothetical protein NDU88_010612 [Pleurodeles waltl]|uniref:Uncharacterized protein n=1 Tax=Pleurodeles waltl TaxID=8319 RepID=A0AAV7S2F0_PLEWA|nr:hypothetical protein NDU88_010612 [Pleurodeles waltl]